MKFDVYNTLKPENIAQRSVIEEIELHFKEPITDNKVLNNILKFIEDEKSEKDRIKEIVIDNCEYVDKNNDFFFDKLREFNLMKIHIKHGYPRINFFDNVITLILSNIKMRGNQVHMPLALRNLKIEESYVNIDFLPLKLETLDFNKVKLKSELTMVESIQKYQILNSDGKKMIFDDNMEINDFCADFVPKIKNGFIKNFTYYYRGTGRTIRADVSSVKIDNLTIKLTRRHKVDEIDVIGTVNRFILKNHR